jgi:hypothetical protein
MTLAAVEDANASIRSAVTARIAAVQSDKPSELWYGTENTGGGCCDGGRCHAPQAPQAPTGQKLRPGSEQFLAICDQIKALHLSKTLDYGAEDDALANIRSGADLINVPAWTAALVRIADKVTRLRSFCRRGKTEFDGVEDTLLDLAAYSIIALTLYKESTNAARKAI